MPFWLTVLVTILLIWLYTFRAGIKTIVWTDTLQTLFMLSAVVVSIYLVGEELELSAGGMVAAIRGSDMSQVFFWDWQSGQNFFKQFILRSIYRHRDDRAGSGYDAEELDY